jgi:hypothetical protein
MNGITVEIRPDGRLSKNGLRRASWKQSSDLIAKARADAYVLGMVEMNEMDESWETPDQVSVSIVQYYARNPFDYDGLACVCGPTIDGLVDCGILADDDPAHIVRYELSHYKVKTMAENRVTITVTPVRG